MKNKLLILLLALVSFSCFDEEDAPALLPNGTYTGQFIRTSPNALHDYADVAITVKGNTFTGTSDKMYYPAIGSGTYSISGDKIDFENEGFWTANFDWTLILDDTYTISTDAEGFTVLTLRRGDVTDIYRLKKQVGNQ